MQMRLRPEIVAFGSDKPALSILEIRLPLCRIDVRRIRRSGATRLVHNIDGVTLPQEELSPAFAIIRRSREIRSGLPETVNHDDRIRMRLSGRNLVFDVELTCEYL